MYSMPTKVAGGADVTSVIVAVDESSLAFAVTCSTFEDVHLTALNINDSWSGPEKGIGNCWVTLEALQNSSAGVVYV